MSSYFAYIVIYGLLAWFIWPILLVAITIATPKKLLKKYFKEPHFNAGELMVFGSFPGVFMRTSIFCRFYLTPKAVKGRQMEGFVEDSPQWYRVAVLVIILGAIIHAVFVFLPMIITYIYDHFLV